MAKEAICDGDKELEKLCNKSGSIKLGNQVVIYMWSWMTNHAKGMNCCAERNDDEKNGHINMCQSDGEKDQKWTQDKSKWKVLQG